MKKQKFFPILVLFLLLFASLPIHAKPLYYTFEGTVTRDLSYLQNTELSNLSEGDPVSFTYYVYDQPFDLKTTHYDLGGVSYYFGLNTLLVSGPSALFPTDVEKDEDSSYEAQLGRITSYVGYSGSGNISHADFSFYGYGPNGSFTLYSYQDQTFQREALNSYSDFTDWAVNNIRSSDNILTVYNSDGERQLVPSFAYLTLTSISEISPSSVPEPSTILLLASGLLGIRHFKLKKNR